MAVVVEVIQGGLNGKMPEIETSYDEADENPLLNTLAQTVRQAFMDADLSRRSSGLEDRMIRALRARRGEYEPADAGKLGGINIYLGVFAQKARAFESWTNDILANSIDKPWTLKATPLPDLPDRMKDLVVEELKQEVVKLGFTPDIADKAKEYKELAIKSSQNKANYGVSRMERKIEDQMVEGGWREAFSEFLGDLGTFPFAVLAGPLVQNIRKFKWENEEAIERIEPTMIVKRISPFDFYWSTEASSVQEARFLIWRMRYTKSEFYNLLGLPGVNEQNIRYIIENYGDSGFKEWLMSDEARNHLEGKDQVLTDGNTLDVLAYYGQISGSDLLMNGVPVEDPQKDYDAMVWVMGGYVIRAVLNPYPLGARPFYVTSFVQVPGSMAGEGLYDILEPIQRCCNSSVRSLVRNMSFASGPITEADMSRFADGELPQEIVPFRVYATNPDPLSGGHPALKFNKVPSVSAEMWAIFENFSKLADDYSGIPAYVLGNPQVAGAGRTLGGLSMLMGNAAKGIKNIIYHIDKDVIEPLVRAFYNMNLKYSDDASIKAEAYPVARGSSGILQRELSQARAAETLSLLTPYIQSGLVPPQAALLLLREICKTIGIPVDDLIPDPQRAAEVASTVGATQPSARPATAGTVLDGRSVPPVSPDMLERTPQPMSDIPSTLPQGE